jgi:hypothetical protein
MRQPDNIDSMHALNAKIAIVDRRSALLSHVGFTRNCAPIVSLLLNSSIE